LLFDKYPFYIKRYPWRSLFEGFLTVETSNHARPTKRLIILDTEPREVRGSTKPSNPKSRRSWYLFLLFSILVVLGLLIMTTSDNFFFTGLALVIARLAAVGSARLGAARWDY
jgi:hypothetical protein